MSRNQYDAIVIGVGAMGSAACDQLARRGLRVLGIERHEIGHELGSSHGLTRVIRKAYFEDPRYVPLLHATYRLWREIESDSAESLLQFAGCINIGPREHPAICGVRRSVEEHRLAHEVLVASAIRRRWPAFECRDDDVGVYEGDAGFLRPERCIAAMVARSARAGAMIRTQERVTRWRSEQGRATVETDKGCYESERLVLTGGSWLGDLVREPGLPLVVERQVQAWFVPKNPDLFRVGRLPCFIHFTPEGVFYGIPIDESAPPPFDRAVKIARHHGGATTTADGVQREVTADDEAIIRAYIRRHIPAADGALAAARVCMYTNTPDDHFVIDRHPRLENVWLAGGFSGHGFKFAPVVGEILADLAITGRTRHPIELFSVARFAAR